MMTTILLFMLLLLLQGPAAAAGAAGAAAFNTIIATQQLQPPAKCVGPSGIVRDISDEECQHYVRQYHPVSLGQLATNANAPTHVETTGTVTLVKLEDDGDRHLRISDHGAFIVAECVPYFPSPCANIRRGQRIRVRGISRYDSAHRWHEINPVEHIEVVH
jgi:hypothetical protein